MFVKFVFLYLLFFTLLFYFSRFAMLFFFILLWIGLVFYIHRHQVVVSALENLVQKMLVSFCFLLFFSFYFYSCLHECYLILFFIKRIFICIIETKRENWKVSNKIIWNSKVTSAILTIYWNCKEQKKNQFLHRFETV